MKWFKESTYLKDRYGEVRTIEKFLWFPKCLLDRKSEKEVYRWLETAKIRQEVDKLDIGGTCEYGRYGYYWVDEEWV